MLLPCLASPRFAYPFRLASESYVCVSSLFPFSPSASVFLMTKPYSPLSVLIRFPDRSMIPPFILPQEYPSSPSLCASLLSECDLGSDSVVPFHHRFLPFHASMQFSLPFLPPPFCIHCQSRFCLFTPSMSVSSLPVLIDIVHLLLSFFSSSRQSFNSNAHSLLFSVLLFISSRASCAAVPFPFSLPNSCLLLLLPFFPSPSLCLPCQGAVSVYGTESTRLLRLLQSLPRNALPHFQLDRSVPFSMSALLVAPLQSHPSVHRIQSTRPINSPMCSSKISISTILSTSRLSSMATS